MDSLAAFEKYQEPGGDLTSLLAWQNHPEKAGYEMVALEIHQMVSYSINRRSYNGAYTGDERDFGIRHHCHEALVGIVFRVQYSRSYYQFGIEGKRKVVLYRRIDDEWLPLTEAVLREWNAADLRLLTQFVAATVMLNRIESIAQ